MNMSETSVKFILRGSIYKSGKKFGCEVTLSTPDLKKITINTGFIYSSSKEAKEALNEKLKEIQSNFAKHPNIVMIDKEEGIYTEGIH
jgi:hypothetical protein